MADEKKRPGRAPLFKDDLTIKVNQKALGKFEGANPKRKGSAAAARFDQYRDGMTIAEHRAAVGPLYSSADLVVDLRAGYVSIPGHDLYAKDGTQETYRVFKKGKAEEGWYPVEGPLRRPAKKAE